MQNVSYPARNSGTSGCQTLAADQNLNRHNQVAAMLHLDICRHFGIKWKQSAGINIRKRRQLSWGTPQSSLTHVSPATNQT